jgi:hypothetical protein
LGEDDQHHSQPSVNGASGSPRGRTRRRHSRKRLAPPLEEGDLVPHRLERTTQVSPSPGAAVHSVSPCILGWSHAMSSAEEDLKKAVVISVISERSSVPGEEVAALLAPWLEVEEGSLSLLRLSVSSFLLFLPSVRLIQLLEEKKSLLKAPSFSVLCQQWSRFANSSGGILPFLVNFHLDGIPVHAWEAATVERLLKTFASVFCVQSDLDDLTSFRCSAWCVDPALIPDSRELWITEPLQSPENAGQGFRTLIYQVRIHWSFPSSSAEHGPPPSLGDSGARDRARRSPRSRSPPGNGRGQSSRPRRSVMERLGPQINDGQSNLEGRRSSASNKRCSGIETFPMGASALVPLATDLGDIDEGISNLVSRAGLEASFVTALAPVPLVPLMARADKEGEHLVYDHRAGLETPSLGVSAPVYMAATSPIDGATAAETLNCDHRAGLEAPSLGVSALGRSHGMLDPISVRGGALSVAGTVSPRALLVYSRRRPILADVGADSVSGTADRVDDLELSSPTGRQELLEGQAGDDCSADCISASVLDTTTSDVDHSLVQDFLATITKPVDCILARPATQKRRRKQTPKDFIPRRSNRLKKDGRGAPSTAVRKIRVDIARTLGILADQEGLAQEALDEYGRLFSKPLSQDHVAALAALFGWAIPENADAADSLLGQSPIIV